MSDDDFIDKAMEEIKRDRLTVLADAEFANLLAELKRYAKTDDPVLKDTLERAAKLLELQAIAMLKFKQVNDQQKDLLRMLGVDIGDPPAWSPPSLGRH